MLFFLSFATRIADHWSPITGSSFAGLSGESSRRFRNSSAGGSLHFLLDPPVKPADDEEGGGKPVGDEGEEGPAGDEGGKSVMHRRDCLITDH